MKNRGVEVFSHRRIRCGIAILLFGLAPCRLWATAQFPEVLRIDGKEYALETTPLAPYLETYKGDLPRLEVFSSANWRGYIGTWEIRDGKLFLLDVRMGTKALLDWDAPKSEQYRSVMKELFGESGPPQAKWFTGRLIVPTGEVVEYADLDFAGTYSSYFIVTVVRGVVRDQRNMTRKQFEGFRRKQFKQFKKTSEYATAFQEVHNGDPKMSDKEVEDCVFQLQSGFFESKIFD